MDGETLVAAMRPSRVAASQLAELAPAFTVALAQAHCTTVNRAAMFAAQIGHETSGLYYREEIANGSAYEGRASLGNTQAGDGRRFKGRGWIQLTGRSNYSAFSRWCHMNGMTNFPDHFVRNPILVAQPHWGALAAAWYWSVARAKLNTYADAGDVLAASKAVNGVNPKTGLPNGLSDRTNRWRTARALGTRLLSTTLGDDMAQVPQVEWNAVRDRLLATENTWGGGTDEVLDARGMWMRMNVETRQCWLAVQRCQAGIDDLKAMVAALAAGKKL